MKRLIFILIALPLLASAQSYKIYSTSKQKQVTINHIIDDMAKADVLFFGEEHNDSVGHSLELLLFQQLAEKYPQKAALSLEMFETDTQPILNEYLGGLIREKNFVTEARAWPNYKDYRPLIELAKEKHLPVIAANAPARYTNRVTRLGLSSLQQLDVNAKSWLPPLPVDTASGAYHEKFAAIMGGHGSMPGMQLYQSQSLWDATMAWSVARFLKTHPGYKVLQINGGFHSEDKLGAPAQLKNYAPNTRILNIAAFATDNFEQIDWSKYNSANDYVIVTDGRLIKADN
ncbi:ChaN family lipoprotein [Mucilaginibacter sp. Bleaf8]|uniref:ChaN family lipoprotein n=1 Tax=Mucilaginibacter sp. Bleaf8 TaxID=2834430 RepID=UPI001BCFA640|nr:ChaN family lipoprotein [Mucilaginibacter sp. Bleaf8]MBS7565189.1 ChaN family lipoprotein [Mucilaginibacter sp. Bleaf8]